MEKKSELNAAQRAQLMIRLLSKEEPRCKSRGVRGFLASRVVIFSIACRSDKLFCHYPFVAFSDHSVILEAGFCGLLRF